jgi:type VI secretion system secreted protein VgrG
MYADQNRTIQFTTPLGPDKLFATALQGREAVSELFSFHIDAMTEERDPIAFDKLLGEKVTVKIELAKGNRFFNGIVIGLTQAAREEVLTHYHLVIAPSVWTLTRNAQSRIFQQMSVPDILKEIFTGKDVDYQLQGTYQPREYCTQYRETDFNFASRLMEEEGIFYFFKHTASANTMVVGDSPQVFQDLPVAPKAIYELSGASGILEDRVLGWQKAQDLRSGKSTLWDYAFQIPDQNCMATAQVQDTVQAGTVSHKLKVAGNAAWELYDYPGAFGKRFDDIDKGGGSQSGKFQHIFDDKDRTVKIRMQQETARGLAIHGQAAHAGFISGFNFQLSGHYSDDGEYTLISVEHDASQPLGDKTPFQYKNNFRAIPVALPFLPPRTAPEPFVHGPQTAVVVGPSGEEIFTDKYGRVKVQFHWDRQGTNDANSSCWLRVGSHWAGKQWGAIHIPRIGQEVIVAFLEGDPDQPIVVGSVYNADNMPPYTLPDNKTQSGIISRSTKGGASANFNQIRFEDKMGSEEVNVQAEKDMNTLIKNDETRHVKHDRTTNIDNDETKTVLGKETITITGNQATEIKQGDQSNLVDQGNQTNEIKMGNQSTKLDMGNQSTELSMGNQTTKVDLGSISVEAMQSITLKVGASKITIDQMGVTIEGMTIKVNATLQLQEQALMIQSTASAMMQIQGAITMIN